MHHLNCATMNPAKFELCNCHGNDDPRTNNAVEGGIGISGVALIMSCVQMGLMRYWDEFGALRMTPVH